MGHEHLPASVDYRTNPWPGLRRTGIQFYEVCACGARRYVWLTTFSRQINAWFVP